MKHQEIIALLEHAPTDPGPIAHGLVGWRSKDGREYCSKCIGRLMARGFGLKGFESVWVPENIDCNTAKGHTR